MDTCKVVVVFDGSIPWVGEVKGGMNMGQTVAALPYMVEIDLAQDALGRSNRLRRQHGIFPAGLLS